MNICKCERIWSIANLYHHNIEGCIKIFQITIVFLQFSSLIVLHLPSEVDFFSSRKSPLSYTKSCILKRRLKT